MKKVFALAGIAALSTSLFAADGATIYKSRCAGCHGADGSKTIAALGVKPLNTAEVKKMGPSGVSDVVAHGRNKMPGFQGKMTPDEINAVSAYVLTLK